MKKQSKAYFEANYATAKGVDSAELKHQLDESLKAIEQKILQKIEPTLEQHAEQFAMQPRDNTTSVFNLSSIFGNWKHFGLALASGAAAVIAVVVFTNIERSQPQNQVAAIPAAPTASPLVPDANLAALSQKLDEAKPILPVVIPVAEPAAPVPKLAQVHKKPKAQFQKVAVEFLGNIDLLLVLPVLKDLDVLQKWSGSTHASFFWMWPTISILNQACAADVPANSVDDVPIGDDFLDHISKIFPTIPPQEQAKIVSGLKRLRPIWKENKVALVQNYKVWSQSSAQEKQHYDRQFATWKKLPQTNRTEILTKYDRWKKLSPAEQARIRKQLTRATSTQTLTHG